MKKSVLALLILLAVLIVTCVYQKTYTIYSTSPKEIKLVERKTTTNNQSTAKTVTTKNEAAKEKEAPESSTLPAVSVPAPTKHVEAKPVHKTKPAVEHKPVISTEKSVTHETKSETEPSMTKATSTQKVDAVITKEVRTAKTETTENTVTVTQNTAEKEIVDYLMWALKNRDIALKNRDEVEARIQELINKALKDRELVLEERRKNEVALEKLQTELIDARDASYESVINPTTNQGEK